MARISPPRGKVSLYCSKENLYWAKVEHGNYEWGWACNINHDRTVYGRSVKGSKECRENLISHLLTYHQNHIPITALVRSVGPTE